MSDTVNDPILDLAVAVGGKITQLDIPQDTAPTQRPLRIYWSSNHPLSISGYGNQTRETVTRIKRSGIDIACGNFYGQDGFISGGVVPAQIDGEDDISLELLKIPQYPKMIATWGDDGCIYHAQDFGADCVITLQDSWPLDPNALRQVKNWIPYVPIDHKPTPKIILDRMKLAYRIISMSKFGHDQLEREGFSSTYIPHMVDTKKMAILDKKECRKMLNIPEDIYLFGIIGANKELPSRKGFEHMIKAFAEFHKKHPKSGIYFHVNMNQPGGLNIIEWADILGISDCIYYLPPYIQQFKTGRDQLTKIINAFDCLLATSISEGFGIPIIEAQACGVPAITTDWTSMTELVENGKTGYAVKVKEERISPLASYFGIPDEEDILDKMNDIYDHPMDPKYIRQRIIDTYDSEFVFETYWKPFLTKISEELVV